MRKNNQFEDSRLADLVSCGREIMAARGDLGAPELPPRWLLVDVTGQRLVLLHDGRVEWEGPVSTALAGIDCRQDSGGTPSGLHRIREKIGAGFPRGTIFESRQPVDRVWSPDHPETEDEDLILTRILTLEGCEDGLNRGQEVDSLSRYIYIHGTNHEGRIGRPVSHGCIRMNNDDVVELFDQVEAGDPVLII